MINILTYIGLFFLVSHELDAVLRREYKIIKIFGVLSDKWALSIFILLHIPLFYLIFWALFHANPQIRILSQIILNSFYILHFFLHQLFRDHRNNKMNTKLSWSIINLLMLVGILQIIHLYFIK